MRSAGLEEAQAGIKIAGRNINNLRYADNTTLMGESGLAVLFLRHLSLSPASFNFIAAVTICSDFGAQKNNV